MAEAVVGSLLLKIGSALVIEPVKYTCSFLTSEASAMHSFFDEMRDIRAELEGIRGFLHEAERFSEMHANIKLFIAEIRMVAFDIEDIVDEFTYKLYEHMNRGVVVKTIKRVVHVKTWYKLTKMLRKIKTQLVNIHNRKNTYETSGILQRREPQEVGRWITAEDEHFKKEGDLVGIDENKKKLMEMLSDDKSKQNVISVVWGMGGVGKTTLVTHVYNTMKQSFDGCAWVTVSQTWERDELLRKILQELHREDPNGINIDGIDTKDFRSLVLVITKYLHNKRYLLILDDVWHPDLWHFIRDKLPEDNAAQIILTTRNRAVALLAPEQQIMNIIPLEKHHSWDLFCKTTFKKNNTRTCPEELTMWARKIVEKCGGIPLAILAIGGIMARKEQTEREWKRMWEDLEHELPQNIDYVYRILQLSFADLSWNLKNCLLCFSIYPEDYMIPVVHLTNQWIAEGFVEISERRTRKETAEESLNELVSRCLLQVVERDEVGRVQICRMHDIIHTMVVSKSKEEEFCVVRGSSTRPPNGRVRRMSIQNCNLENSSNNEYARNNEYSLRSIFNFGDKISVNSLSIMLRSSKLLRVLNLYGASIEKLPEEVYNLFNLNYLGLDETGIKELSKSIGRLENLQILSAARAEIRELPDELTKLRRLRVLMVFPKYGLGVMPPKQIRKLENLQVVGYINATNEMVRNFETLFKLKSLFITEIRSEHCEFLFTAISKFSHLDDLTVMAEGGEVLQLQALNTSASEIMISGQVERTSVPFFTSLQHHNRIRELMLFDSGLDEYSFSFLQGIRSLRILYLTGYEGNELCFHEMSFSMLRELQVKEAPPLECIKIKKGAMPNLEDLYISNCPELKELPRGIEYLSKLQRFEWGNPDGTLVERVQRERTEDQLSNDRTRILSLINFTS